MWHYFILLMTAWYSIEYTYHIFFIHSFASGHLDRFHVLDIINSAAMNTGVLVSFWNIVFWLPRWLSGKESTSQSRRRGFDPWVRKIPRRRKWRPTLVFVPGKSHGQGSLVGYTPWGHKRVGHDLMTKQQQQLNMYPEVELLDHMQTLALAL